MKNFIKIVLFFSFGIMALSTFTSCSKDDEPDSSSSIYGVWTDGITTDDEGIYDLLITKDVWLWNSNASVLTPYIKSSYKELAARFAPDDEFLIYRYDSKNDVYLLYESMLDENGNLSYDVKRFGVAKLKVYSNTLECILYMNVDNPLYADSTGEEGIISYEEVMKNSIFGTLPEVELAYPEYITYTRYNK